MACSTCAFLWFACRGTAMQNTPVCRLRNQFLPFGYEAFGHISSYFMFPKRIHSLPHSSFLRENKTKWKHEHRAQIYRFKPTTEGHEIFPQSLTLLFHVCLCLSVSCSEDLTFTAALSHRCQLQLSDRIGQKHVEAELIVEHESHLTGKTWKSWSCTLRPLSHNVFRVQTRSSRSTAAFISYF